MYRTPLEARILALEDNYYQPPDDDWEEFEDEGPDPDEAYEQRRDWKAEEEER